MVRETLGEDAIIVATREEKGGKAVRVTAAIERQDDFEDEFERQYARRNQQPALSDDEDWLYDDDSGDEDSAVLETLTDTMLRHAVPEEVTDQIISCATVIGLENAGISLIAALEHLFAFHPMPREAVKKAYMLVGPPGAGKTLATAKLAARGVLADLRVAVITTDTVRAGGIEQLDAFTRLMHTDLMKAGSPAQLKECLERAGRADQIFVDTGGLNPFDPDEMRKLARYIAAGNIEPVLVMPAGMDAEESGEIARIYASLGVRTVMPSRLDIARRMGGLLSAAHYGGLAFTDAGNTPKVADGLISLSPKRLSNLLMPESTRRTQEHPVRNPKRHKVNAG